MVDWSFLKNTEFWVTTIIAIILAFSGGFFSGKAYEVNGLIVKDSRGSIVTQNQQGDNLLINSEKPQRILGEGVKSKMSSMLSPYVGNKIMLHYSNGDMESFNYAKEIKEYLESQFWVVSDPMSTTWFGDPKNGVEINFVHETLTINVYEQ